MNQDNFICYLRAKKSVDDRALNLRVWHQLKESLAKIDTSDLPIRVLEIGGGIGTMLMRMLEDELLPDCEYCLLDINEQVIQYAPDYLAKQAKEEGFTFQERGQKGFTITAHERKIDLELVCADVFDFIANSEPRWDLVIANAVLDLFDLAAALPRLVEAVTPGGLLYFTINYDGHTIFEPQLNPSFEEKLLQLYSQTMDERLTNGKPSGDSRTGRHLFSQFKKLGVEILAAGSSDWVVFPGSDGYPGEEADFLRCLIDTIDQQMKNHPRIDLDELEHWIEERKNQIQRGNLVCIVHQLDLLGRAQH